MDIRCLDKNFINNNVDTDKFDWYDFSSPNFCLYGVFYDKTEGQFLRLPRKIANDTSVGVDFLANQTSGGRLKFCTNSKTIAISAQEGLCSFKSHIPVTGQMGFALYTDGKYERTFAPDLNAIESRKDELFSFSTCFKTIYPKPQGEFYDYVLHFPLYSSVKKLLIGVERGSDFIAPKKYANELPILFYGSSITQGACASHPGNEYQGHISRALDVDYINLGFAGKALGEQVMAKYVREIPHSLFVMDYDNNAPTLEHLEKTHYAFYKTYREKCKDTPIIFLTKPNWWIDFPADKFAKRTTPCTKIIKQTYKKALAKGDKNVYFIDGKSFFGKDLYDCTVDSIHPNDHGFYLMAKKLIPVIQKALRR